MVNKEIAPEIKQDLGQDIKPTKIGDPEDHDLFDLLNVSRKPGCVLWATTQAVIGVGGTALAKEMLPPGDNLLNHWPELLIIWGAITPTVYFGLFLSWCDHLDRHYYPLYLGEEGPGLHVVTRLLKMPIERSIDAVEWIRRKTRKENVK